MSTEYTKSNLYKYDPFAVCIVGGADTLPEDERGPLDTPTDTAHPLFDERLRTTAITPEFMETIKVRSGVDTPIEVRKLKGVTCVVAGRKRVRAMRKLLKAGVELSNPQVPAIVVDAVGAVALMEAMLIENQGREADTFEVQVAKLKRYIALRTEEDGKPCAPEEAARAMNMKPQQAKVWLKFDASAVDDVKAAVYADKISVSAAMEIQRNAKTPDAQLKALKAVLDAGNGKKTSTQAARTIAKKSVNAEVVVGIADRRSQRAFLQLVEDAGASSKGNEKTLMWWQGVEDGIKAILGERDADKRLLDLIEKLRATQAKKGG